MMGISTPTPYAVDNNVGVDVDIPSRPERPSGTLQNRTFDWFLAMMLPAVGDNGI
jgi:hypothetical protein